MQYMRLSARPAVWHMGPHIMCRAAQAAAWLAGELMAGPCDHGDCTHEASTIKATHCWEPRSGQMPGYPWMCPGTGLC